MLRAHDDILTESRIREIVKEALKVYDADKTGRVDYALESAGKQSLLLRGSIDGTNLVVLRYS